MDYQSVVQSLTPDTVARLRSAVELGRWPDGRRLSEAQRAQCLAAVIAWESVNLPPPRRTGYIDRGRVEDGDRCGDEQPQILRLREQ